MISTEFDIIFHFFQCKELSTLNFPIQLLKIFQTAGSFTIYIWLLSDPTVKVLGDPDLFINAGSFINLTCTGDNLPGTPEDVYWYHQEQVTLPPRNPNPSTKKNVLHGSSIQPLFLQILQHSQYLLTTMTHLTWILNIWCNNTTTLF